MILIHLIYNRICLTSGISSDSDYSEEEKGDHSETSSALNTALAETPRMVGSNFIAQTVQHTESYNDEALAAISTITDTTNILKQSPRIDMKTVCLNFNN